MPINTYIDHPATIFIARLTGVDQVKALKIPVSIKTFDDLKLDYRLTSVFHAPLKDIFPRLNVLNELGAGIFVTVNETDLAGTSKGNITGIRGYHVDVDDKLATKPLVVQLLPLIPSMIVGSAHGKHLYYLLKQVEPCAGDEPRRKEHESELKAIQAKLECYGADRVCDSSRVMRLPGFYNNKGGLADRKFVTIESISPYRYTREQVTKAYPSVTPPPCQNYLPLFQPLAANNLTLTRARAYLEQIPGAVDGMWGGHRTFNTALKLISRFGLDVETAFELMWSEFNPRCQPPWSEQDLRRKVHEASKRARLDLLEHRPKTLTRHLGGR